MKTSLHPEKTVFVGLDVHKKTIVLCARFKGGVLLQRTFLPTKLNDMRKALKKLAESGQVVCCYEASGAGFVLQRRITEWGYVCHVVAPSLIPQKPGDRRKCDRLDAEKLAEFLAHEQLTVIHVPTAEEESARDLVRLRFAVRKDVTRAKHRVVKFLDRKGHHFPGKAWTQIHRKWLSQQEFLAVTDRITFEHLLGLLISSEARLAEIDKEIRSLAETPRYREPVSWLMAFRGVNVLSAMVFVTELGDIRRFPSPRKLMAFLGLVPGVHQSGDSKRGRCSITKAGNRYLRHILTQAAWNYRAQPRNGPRLKKQLEQVPLHVQEHSWKAQRRIHKRLHHLAGKRSWQIAIPAGARELACFLGATLKDYYESHHPAPTAQETVVL